MSDCVTHEIIQTLWQNFTETSRGRQGGSGGGVGNSNSTGNIGGGSGSMLRDGRGATYNQRYSMRQSASANVNSSGQNDDYHDSRFASNYSNVENI